MPVLRAVTIFDLKKPRADTRAARKWWKIRFAQMSEYTWKNTCLALATNLRQPVITAWQARCIARREQSRYRKVYLLGTGRLVTEAIVLQIEPCWWFSFRGGQYLLGWYLGVETVKEDNRPAGP